MINIFKTGFFMRFELYGGKGNEEKENLLKWDGYGAIILT